MNKIKIVHILHSVGGVDVSLRQILLNINTSEFECVVIHGNNDTAYLFQNSAKNHVKEYKVPIFRNISLKNDFIAIKQALKIIKEEKPNLIHSHSTKGGVIARIIGLMTGVKVLHTPQAFSYLCTQNRLKRAIYLGVEKILSKGNSVLLASSQSELNRAIDEVGYSSAKTALFNNAIEPIKNLPTLSISKTWPDNYLCTVGRPCYQKNIEEQIRILYEINKTQRTHLVLMGVGYYADQLELVRNLIIELKLQDKVTILNWTSREDVLQIVKKSKIYLSTARYEGLPYAIIESLALGVPCVVSNCDGNRDLIQNNYNGYCIVNNSREEFVQKVLNLLNNEVLYEQLSTNAETTFENYHNIHKEIFVLESIYKAQIK